MSVPSGVPELDDVLDGGLPRGTVTLAIGAVTPAIRHLARSFLLDGLGRMEAGVLIEAREPIETERATLAELDPHLDAHEAEERLRYVDASVRGSTDATTRAAYAVRADPWNLNGLTAAIERARRELSPRAEQRVVLDALDPLLDASDPSPMARFLQVLLPRLERAGVTTLIVAEHPERLGHAMDPVEGYAPVRLRFREDDGTIEVSVDGDAAPQGIDPIRLPPETVPSTRDPPGARDSATG